MLLGTCPHRPPVAPAGAVPPQRTASSANAAQVDAAGRHERHEGRVGVCKGQRRAAGEERQSGGAVGPRDSQRRVETRQCWAAVGARVQRQRQNVRQPPPPAEPSSRSSWTETLRHRVLSTRVPCSETSRTSQTDHSEQLAGGEAAAFKPYPRTRRTMLHPKYTCAPSTAVQCPDGLVP